jgi:hypothetical protein
MMKKAKIKPLIKKGDRQDIKNYRPISTLLAFPKPLEKLMHNRLLLFLIRHTKVYKLVKNMVSWSQNPQRMLVTHLNSVHRKPWTDIYMQ